MPMRRTAQHEHRASQDTDGLERLGGGAPSYDGGRVWRWEWRILFERGGHRNPGERRRNLDDSRNTQDLDEALRHARAGIKALEAARQAAADTGQIYPTHVHLAAVELAHAIEVSMKVALRSG